MREPVVHSLRIVAEHGTASYEFTASGAVEPDPSVGFDASLNVSGGNAEGTVSSEPHAYRFTGELTDLRYDDGAVVTIDGRCITPSTPEAAREPPEYRSDGGTALPTDPRPLDRLDARWIEYPAFLAN